MYCPGGNWEPSTVSPGYYSIGGDGATTRIGQVRSESKPEKLLSGRLDSELTRQSVRFFFCSATSHGVGSIVL